MIIAKCSDNTKSIKKGIAAPKKLPKRKLYKKSSMLEAIHAVKNKGYSQKEAARLFKVPCSSLNNKLLNRYPLSEEPKTVLTKEEEENIVEWIAKQSMHGYKTTSEDICSRV